MRLLCTILLVSAVATVAVQRATISKLRREKATHLAANKEVERLARENRGISRLRMEEQTTRQLRAENRDLLKLRNEVRQLREQTEELEKVRTENQRLMAAKRSNAAQAAPATEPQPFTSTENLADAGLMTPEATLQTFFWAMREGNWEKLRQCLTTKAQAQVPRDNPGQIRGGGFEQFKGYRVAGKKTVGTDEVLLGFQLATGEEVAFPLKREENQWKIDFPTK